MEVGGLGTWNWELGTWNDDNDRSKKNTAKNTK